MNWPVPAAGVGHPLFLISGKAKPRRAGKKGSKIAPALDSERSWVVLTEANDFIWPGPDLRPAIAGDLDSVAYGFLPPKFMAVLRERLVALYRDKKSKTTRRTE